jgi:nitrogen fixation/metabolism regulation signal transduction histidine kinase
VIAIIVARSVTTPIEVVTDQAAQVAIGDLSQTDTERS